MLLKRSIQMNVLKKILFSMAVAVLPLFSMGQDAPQAEKKQSLDEGTIESQFDYLIKKSNRYEDYKVVKISWLNKMKGNVKDSLDLSRNNLKDAQAKITQLDKQVGDLQADLERVNGELSQVTKEKNSMVFLGKLVGKAAYNTIMWSIIGLSLAFAVFCFLMFRRSHTVTNNIKLALKDVQEEFDKHRKWALEREQKLARDLHKARTQGGME